MLIHRHVHTSHKDRSDADRGRWHRQRGKQRIRERIDYEGRIWHQANFDSLTGLSNRNLFMDRLERAMAYARRDSHQLALLFIDLDRFKDVNDIRGHAIGDHLLQEAARRLQTCVRDMDTVSRLGGDEFMVILPEVAESRSATVVTDQILQALAQPFALQTCDAHLSASIGITIFPRDGGDPGTLLQNADTAMYQAKAAGRNTYRYFTPEMNQQTEGRVILDTAMRQAGEYGHDLDDELTILLVHGVLHLRGHDHHEVSDAEAMRAQEESVLTALGVDPAGLVGRSRGD